MSTFLQVSGALFWLSLGAGGLWVGLCAFTDWWKSRRDVDVTDFGAIGDGKADDTDAVQRAANFANAAGRVLRFPTGTYLVRPFRVGEARDG